MSSDRSQPSLFPDLSDATGHSETVVDVARERQHARRQQRKHDRAVERAQRSERPQQGSPTAGRPGMDAGAARYLDVQALAKRWDVGVSTIWRWTKQGIIPQPYHIGTGATRWAIEEIEAYEQACAGRRK
jgi:prophage regulatory protein